MKQFTLYVDGGGTATSPTYFSYKCLETQQADYNPIAMNKFYLFNLASELLPNGCYVVDTQGNQSNNIAEYASIYYGLLRFKQFYDQYPVTIYHDSQFVVYSILGKYQVKKEHLIPWYNAVRRLWWNSIDYRWIEREEIVRVLGH